MWISKISTICLQCSTITQHTFAALMQGHRPWPRGFRNIYGNNHDNLCIKTDMAVSMSFDFYCLYFSLYLPIHGLSYNFVIIVGLLLVDELCCAHKLVSNNQKAYMQVCRSAYLITDALLVGSQMVSDHISLNCSTPPGLVRHIQLIQFPANRLVACIFSLSLNLF